MMRYILFCYVLEEAVVGGNRVVLFGVAAFAGNMVVLFLKLLLQEATGLVLFLVVPVAGGSMVVLFGWTCCRRQQGGFV